METFIDGGDKLIVFNYLNVILRTPSILLML